MNHRFIEAFVGVEIHMTASGHLGQLIQISASANTGFSDLV